MLCVCLEILVLLIVKFCAHCTILTKKVQHLKLIIGKNPVRKIDSCSFSPKTPDIQTLVAQLLSQSLFSDTNNRLQRNSSIIIMQVMRKCTNAVLYGSWPYNFVFLFLFFTLIFWRLRDKIYLSMKTERTQYCVYKCGNLPCNNGYFFRSI